MALLVGVLATALSAALLAIVTVRRGLRPLLAFGAVARRADEPPRLPERQLPQELTRVGRPMTGPVNSLTSLIAVQAHFKEALLGQYGTDTLVEPGFMQNTSAAVSINATRIRGAQFVGANPSPYVTGLIDLYLAEIVNSASRSFTKTSTGSPASLSSSTTDPSPSFNTSSTSILDRPSSILTFRSTSRSRSILETCASEMAWLKFGRSKPAVGGAAPAWAPGVTDAGSSKVA